MVMWADVEVTDWVVGPGTGFGFAGFGAGGYGHGTYGTGPEANPEGYRAYRRQNEAANDELRRRLDNGMGLHGEIQPSGDVPPTDIEWVPVRMGDALWVEIVETESNA